MIFLFCFAPWQETLADAGDGDGDGGGGGSFGMILGQLWDHFSTIVGTCWIHFRTPYAPEMCFSSQKKFP